MKEKNLVLILALLFFSVFSACQKEEYKNVNIKLEVDPVTIETDEYVLSGRIISSGKIELSEYGFNLGTGTNIQNYPLGSISKAGKVRFRVAAPGNVNGPRPELELYAFDQYGNYYSSWGEVNLPDPDSGLQPQIEFIQPLHYAGSNAEVFEASVSNLNTDAFFVREYGIYYRSKTNSDWTPYLFDAIKIGDASFLINGMIEAYSTFTPLTGYEYKFYVVTERISDRANIIVFSEINEFAAIGY